MMNTEHITLNSQTTSLKQVVLALLSGLVITLVAVLPAEFGVDPTGVGRALGLTDIHSPAPQYSLQTALQTTPDTANQTAETSAISADQDVVFFDQAAQQQTLNLTLAPGQGIELKVVMQAGQSLLFDWHASGLLYVDMHADKPGAAADDFTRYRHEQTMDSRGQLRAPFDGNHGWYWKNDGAETVSITLTLHGFYQGVFMP